MLDQSYSSKNLARLISLRDFWKYDLGKNKKERFEYLTQIASRINNDDYNFSPFLSAIKYGDKIFIPSNFDDEMALRKLNDNIKRLYKFKQSNRFLIVEQIKSLLLEEVPMSVIKLDIKKFYETINRVNIVKKLLDDSLLSFKSKQLLKKLFALPEISANDGLPRGINVSASMSEIIMRDFDKKISQLRGVYFYARYVDDIVIFTFQNVNDIAREEATILNQETGLQLNKQKTKIIQRKCRCEVVCSCHGMCKCHKGCKCLYDPSKLLSFDYLGYHFSFPDIAKHSDKLMITLSEKKIRKIKTRIIRSFLDFSNNKDFDLLQKRIAFLTGNIVVIDSDQSSLNAGIYYNYPHINEDGLIELDNLTNFLRKTVNARSNSLGSKLHSSLTVDNRKALSKYNFRAGFKNRRLLNYGPAEISDIKKCWIYG